MLGVKVLQVEQPSLGQKVPSEVNAEVRISLEEFPKEIQESYKESLKVGDTLYALRFAKHDQQTKGLNLARGMKLGSWEQVEGQHELRLRVSLDPV